MPLFPFQGLCDSLPVLQVRRLFPGLLPCSSTFNFKNHLLERHCLYKEKKEKRGIKEHQKWSLHTKRERFTVPNALPPSPQHQHISGLINRVWGLTAVLNSLWREVTEVSNWLRRGCEGNRGCREFFRCRMRQQSQRGFMSISYEHRLRE